MTRTTTRGRALGGLAGLLLAVQVVVPLVTAAPAAAVVSTTTTVGSSSPTSVFGQSVTFTSTTTAVAGTVAGTVEFSTNNVTISGCSARPVASNGAATCTTTGLAVGGPNTIRAAYTADSSGVHDNSSGTTTQTVTAASTTTALSSAPNPALFRSSVVFTAVVSPVAPGGGTPTGTVTFNTAPNTPLGTCSNVSLSSGSATCTTDALPRGTTSVTAVYAGTTNYLTSTSNTVSQSVGAVPSTTTLASSANPSVFGQAVLLTATVAGSQPGTPSGTVSFFDGEAAIAGCSSVPLNTDTLTATCSPAPLAPAAHSLKAVYNGNTDFSTSNGTLSQTVNKAATTIEVTSTSPSVSGQSVTFTAAIAVTSPGAGTRTGSVLFKDGTTTLCASSPVSGGAAQCQVSNLATGARTITATYGGDSNFNGSEDTVGHTVDKASTTTALASSANPSVTGQGVTFTATVSPVSPGAGTRTGTVDFFDGITEKCADVPLTAGGTATCAVADLATGAAHSITAVYSGDGNFTTSTSSAVNQVVNKANSSTALTSSKNPSERSESITLTATVTPVSPGAGTPSGTVAFNDGASPIATCGAVALNLSGVATCTTSALTVGSHTLNAVYAGDTNYNTSTSANVVQEVVKHATATDLTASPVTSAPYQSEVTFTAVVTAVTSGVAAPTGGTVTFTDGETAIAGCSAVALASGSASCATSALAIGGHTIKAVYNGNDSTGDYGASNDTVNYTINKIATTTDVVSSGSPSKSGQSVTFTATVTPSGTGTPTGTISFDAGGTAITDCTSVVMSGGTASCTTAALPIGASTIGALYSGDATFATSSDTVSQTVEKASTTTVLASNANPSVRGQNITFTATVAPVSPGAGTPTGTVDFKDGASIFCAAVPLTAGQATCQSADRTVATHSMTAVYSGSSSFLTSTSDALSQVVNKSNTTTAVTSSHPNGSLLNQSVTFTATVTPVSPGAGIRTGNVDFTSDGTAIAGCTDKTLAANGTATCTTSTLSRATHEIVAAYSGDGGFNASTSDPINQVVGHVGSTTTLTATPTPPVAGEAVSLLAAIDANAPGTPTGNVDFKNGGTAIPGCTDVVVTIDAEATCATTFPAGTQNLTADYSGDPNFDASTGVLSLAVAKASTTTALASSKNPSVTGESVSYTATVAPVSPGAGSPTGTVDFKDGDTVVCDDVAVASGQAACAAGTPSVGAHTLTALYTGDGDFNASNGGLTQTVNKAATTATLSTTKNPAVVGEAIQITLTVASVSPGTGTPGGTFAVTLNGDPMCSGSLTNGAVTCGLAAAAGTYTIAGTYNGSDSYSSSTATPYDQVFDKAGTTTALSSSDTSSVTGQSVTFTATVASVMQFSGTPGGTVDFKDGETVVCNDVALASASAQCATAALPVGAHSITAVYSGDTNHLTSTSDAVEQTVAKASTTTALDSSVNPSVPDESTTFTATMTAVDPGSGTPTGTVDFKEGETLLCDDAAVTAGEATCAVSNLSVGSHDITAVYSGDGGFTSSTSSALAHVVSKAASTTALSSSQNPSVFGEAVTLTATPAITSPGTGTPTGTVDFNEGDTVLCNDVALVDGAATCSPTLGVGTHPITAVYSGDGLTNGSSSTALSQVVNKAATTTGLESSASPTVYGQSFTLTATPAVTSPGAATPTGTVDFNEGDTVLCNDVALVDGVATCAPTLGVGTHPITAVYSGDGNTAASTSAPNEQVVDKAATATTLSSSANPSVFGQSVTFTATPTVSTPGSGTPTGTVDFKDGDTVLCTDAALSAGNATCVVNSLAVATHAITAVYSGDGNVLTSTSAAVSQVVNKAATAMALTSSTNPSASGSSVTFTGTPSVSSPGSGTPTGTVTFKDGTTTLCTSALVSGKATCTKSTLSTGSHSITATYNGSTSLLSSVSSVLTQSVGAAPAVHKSGYWMVTTAGQVFAFGDATWLGNAPTNSAVDLEPKPAGDGYWVVDAAGQVFSFNTSNFGGISGRLAAGERATSISSTPDAKGYWVFTTLGRAHAFGNAVHHKDMTGQPLNGPVLDSIATPTGKGYYMVASDGGVFAFGDAVFRGSMAGQPLNGPVQSLVPSSSNVGYWLVATDGGIFAFGDAPFRGSMGGKPLNAPITGMVRYGNGYLMVGEDGGLFSFSDKPFAGSLGGNPPANPVVAVGTLDT